MFREEMAMIMPFGEMCNFGRWVRIGDKKEGVFTAKL